MEPKLLWKEIWPKKGQCSIRSLWSWRKGWPRVKRKVFDFHGNKMSNMNIIFPGQVEIHWEVTKRTLPSGWDKPSSPNTNGGGERQCYIPPERLTGLRGQCPPQRPVLVPGLLTAPPWRASTAPTAPGWWFSGPMSFRSPITSRGFNSKFSPCYMTVPFPSSRLGAHLSHSETYAATRRSPRASQTPSCSGIGISSRATSSERNLCSITPQFPQPTDKCPSSPWEGRCSVVNPTGVSLVFNDIFPPETSRINRDHTGVVDSTGPLVLQAGLQYPLWSIIKWCLNLFSAGRHYLVGKCIPLLGSLTTRWLFLMLAHMCWLTAAILCLHVN